MKVANYLARRGKEVDHLALHVPAGELPDVDHYWAMTDPECLADLAAAIELRGELTKVRAARNNPMGHGCWVIEEVWHDTSSQDDGCRCSFDGPPLCPLSQAVWHAVRIPATYVGVLLGKQPAMVEDEPTAGQSCKRESDRRRHV